MHTSFSFSRCLLTPKCSYLVTIGSQVHSRQVLSSVDEDVNEDGDILGFFGSCMDEILSFSEKVKLDYSDSLSAGRIDALHPFSISSISTVSCTDPQEWEDIELNLFEKLVEVARVIVAYNSNQSRKRVCKGEVNSIIAH